MLGLDSKFEKKMGTHEKTYQGKFSLSSSRSERDKLYSKSKNSATERGWYCYGPAIEGKLKLNNRTTTHQFFTEGGANIAQ